MRLGAVANASLSLIGVDFSRHPPMARILALEDHPDHLALITSWIGASGHTPIAATHAEEALRLIDACRPDLLLCDLHLPGLSGYDVLRSLKNRPATCQLPVVAVTAFGPREQTLAVGFDGYLAKPYTFQGLQAEMERVVPGLARSAPPAPALAPGTEHAGQRTRPPRTGKRILVVDNTAANRALMQVVLDDYGGHETICVAGIAEALASARCWRPDLVLCDMHLDQERCGIELFDAIRNDPDLHGTRFAFTSATRGSSVEKAVRESGACAFFRLPMEPNALLQEVGELLG